MNHNDYQYHDYSVADPPHQPLYLDKIQRLLCGQEGIRRILDAGCGDGNFTQSLFEIGGYQLYGIDLSEGGIARARSRAPDIQFAVSSVYEDFCIPFENITSFDAIVSVEVIEHLYQPRRFIQCAVQALRPGGLLIITTPYWGYLKNIALAATNRTDRALTALWDGGHIKHWSYRTLRILCEEGGLEFVKFQGAGRRMPFMWKGMVMAFRKPTHSLK